MYEVRVINLNFCRDFAFKLVTTTLMTECEVRVIILSSLKRQKSCLKATTYEQQVRLKFLSLTNGTFLVGRYTDFWLTEIQG